MGANWFGNTFKRLPTEVGSDIERSIVSSLEGLLDRPTDENLIDSTIQMLFQDPQKFMSIVAAHFSVPTSVSSSALFAKPDTSPCGLAKKWHNYVVCSAKSPYAYRKVQFPNTSLT